MKKKLDNIITEANRLITKYLDWLETFDTLESFIAIIFTLVIPIILISVIAAGFVSNIRSQPNCLESESPRRYRYHDMTCEEYINSEWVKINPNEKPPVYYYNEGAERIKGE